MMDDVWRGMMTEKMERIESSTARIESKMARYFPELSERIAILETKWKVTAAATVLIGIPIIVGLIS